MRIFFLFLALSCYTSIFASTTVHVFVALCDNQNQGIVPVPEKLGNGQDPSNNLYWGAAYGVKSFFKNKASGWQALSVAESEHPNMLDRALFYNSEQDIYLLAEAYDGAFISTCIADFLLASNHQNALEIEVNEKKLVFGGEADLLAYCGHDGLMEFSLDLTLDKCSEKKPCIALACFSQSYFSPYLEKSGANLILGTTNLMAPEAYTLEAAIETWVKSENEEQTKEAAAQAYHRYQKCGLRGARGLFCLLTIDNSASPRTNTEKANY